MKNTPKTIGAKAKTLLGFHAFADVIKYLQLPVATFCRRNHQDEEPRKLQQLSQNASG
jgi:hypothetical protein